jgi:hypothetical protein
MGQLDDAIREHLELKRRHGAPEEEIVRAEKEALTPARRDPAAGAGVPPLEQVPGEELPGDPADVMPPPPPPPPVDDPVFADEYAAEPAPADFDEPDPDAAPEPALRPVADEPALEEPVLEEAPPPGTAKPHGDPALGDFDEPVVTPEEPTSDPVPDEPHGDPVPPDRARTSILDDPLAEEPSDEGEDVLEETPEFLQDTPEHDKLWFEQKPPRDFDFE